jgi:hypothetical protein
MDPVKVGAIYAIAGSLLLCLTLNLFKVEFKLWQVIAANCAAGLCAAVGPTGEAGLISLVALLAVLRFTTGNTWQDLIYPVVIVRLALVPVLLLVSRW